MSHPPNVAQTRMAAATGRTSARHLSVRVRVRVAAPGVAEFVGHKRERSAPSAWLWWSPIRGEDRDDAGIAIHPGRAPTHGFHQPHPVPGDLPRGRAPAQLPGDLGELREPGRAEGVTPRQEAAAGVDRLGAVALDVPGRCELGAFAAGRIINPRMVQSQFYGGMIWGLSFALHEQAVMDPQSGRPMNANLAEYRVPVNADVPSLEAILVEEHDPHVNALGIKGVGEIGITGTAGAIANAVWHATGIRVRQFPITLDRLIDLR